MAEFCIDCYRKQLAASQIISYTLSESADFCEGCGEYKPYVLEVTELDDIKKIYKRGNPL